MRHEQTDAVWKFACFLVCYFVLSGNNPTQVELWFASVGVLYALVVVYVTWVLKERALVLNMMFPVAVHLVTYRFWMLAVFGVRVGETDVTEPTATFTLFTLTILSLVVASESWKKRND